ncbi:MAG: DUF6786 family protein [Thermoguttaceae bacterium]
MNHFSMILAAALAASGAITLAGETKGKPMSYGKAREYLAKHTQLIELTNDDGARVAICPEWQGRVMTSTCGGKDGLSFGFVNDEFITAGKSNPHFNNFGAEERMWLSPEGGQFSLWFEPGKPQNLDNWFTPPAFNEGAWKVISAPGEPLRMATTMRFQNASGAQFHLDVSRGVRLLGNSDLKQILGESVTKKITAPGAKSVAYETDNRLTNRGADMTREKGLVSVWILGMMNCGPQTVVIVPYKPGSETELGPVVKSDYFGAVPAERLRTLPEAVLLLADGNYRSKIGISQRRARNVLGSIDFQNNVLTLVHFSMPADPTPELYMNNQWGGPSAEPYKGDVANSYNDGPPAPGKKGLGPFYEVESLSPAKPLKTGESLSHQHRTIHIQADPATLADLAKNVLGVELEKVKSEMLAK